MCQVVMCVVHKGSLIISTTVLHLQTLLDNNICSYVTSSYCHIRLERVAVYLHQLCKINAFLNIRIHFLCVRIIFTLR
jgi:hypothetical protein